jgi:tRNA modification GTPase
LLAGTAGRGQSPAGTVPGDCPLPGRGPDTAVLHLSALTGLGLDELRERIKEQAGYEAAEAGTWSARVRHLDALERAAERVERARAQLGQLNAYELVAEDLRQAQQALGEITGEVTSDELLGRIFASFCIGK